jgi:hypothetical protein
VKEQRVLRLDVERGWANGTTVKFARRPHDVTGNIVMKLKQVRNSNPAQQRPCSVRALPFSALTILRTLQVPHNIYSRDGDNLHVTGTSPLPG